ncbi:hypothetical protein [Streptomyces sp. NPDC020965]|uniref:hypothetical protein n=1 Tax=Streptomyces sp. NPDC020965 TaxID=3365105 RepID=UPI0037B433EF
MQTSTVSPAAVRRGGRPRDAAPRVVVVSLDMAASLEWVNRLRRACSLRCVVRPWGDRLGYEYLRRARGVLAVLDCTTPEPVAELTQRVRSLRLLAPVTVSLDTRDDAAALLAAGALNVLHRGASEAAQAARITADVRWLCREIAAEGGGYRGEDDGGPDEVPSRPYKSQSLLLDVLVSAQRPLCCHDVRYLLGEAARPMSLPAVRARIQRLAPHLARQGLVCRRTVRWGADTLTLHAVDGRGGWSGAAG